MKTKQSYTKGQLFGFVLGIVLFILIYWFIPFGTLSQSGVGVLATLALMGSWWIFESINTGITGLVPLFLFPLTGALSAGETASAYGNNTIFMFFGGFAIALALEKWNLHNRIALNIIGIVGTSLNRLIIGLLLAATFISMWVSNTATALMLLPIALAMGSKMTDLILEEDPTNESDAQKFRKSSVWAVAFGAIIGGSMTLIGTPTNISLSAFAGELLGFEIPFAQFMLFEFPLALLQLVVVIFILNNVFYKYDKKQLEKGKDYIDSEIKKLGKMSYEEKVVSVVFALTVFFWIFRTFLFDGIQGLSDTVISIIACVILYIIPDKQGGRILNNDSVSKMPWAVILMLMGGMAVAAGFTGTDLASWLGEQLLLFEGASEFTMVAIVTGFSLLVTQIAPNTATGTIVIPIAASIAQTMGYDPFMLMTAAALGAGFAATVPSGTPLMGIIYGQGDFEMSELIKVGTPFVLASFVGIILVVYFWLPIVF
ncbi:SLC13 family permease [Fundicoccus culcitae]|uniref:Sodium-dependent dicarboxylate transporter SdcS n=1 Tax=Fundicoccus culcitae TaxID=2969821 RepID=A0ABY5P8L2_9LACT|nr:DASS family sodium-coupled anion symporter [Fundicoccus culcitae]UUX35093.1 DASS family sodium-coupled anion symporter [Fundicoccus culcitae]